jgi:DnaJ like chaperone protein
MKKFGKWIGAGLGWTIGGPIGAVLGFAFGSFVDSSNLERFDNRNPDTTTGDFIVSLLVLIASVMKADERVMRSELTFVKNYLTQSFGEEETSEMIKMLRNILKQHIPLKDVTHQIRQSMDYSSRLQLMHLIYGIALSDGLISETEMKQVEHIGSDLGISHADLNSVRSMFVRTNDWAYLVLEVNKNMSDEELAKKYRQMALKNHPDKVAYLGEQITMRASQKFQQINEAWESIKKEREIN